MNRITGQIQAWRAGDRELRFARAWLAERLAGP
jgi:hypothetical protein